MSLPSDYGQTVPYMLVLDRVPEEWPNKEIMEGINEGLRERTGGNCHGFLVFHGELEIE